MGQQHLTDEQVEHAADLLLALRRKDLVLDDLPDNLIPQTTADIQRIIDATNSRIDRPVRGWKFYCAYKPMQPIFYAPIYDLIEDGGTIPAEISPLRLIEPEIMFRVDRSLPRREQRYSHSELQGYVTAFVGMEVVATRFRIVSLEDLYARSKAQKSNYGSLSDNIANGCIVMGETIAGWREVPFEDVPVRMTDGGKTLVEFVGGHPFDDPFLPVLAGVNRLRRKHSLAVGDILVSSSSTSFFPVSAGSPIRAEYEGLGSANATFESV